MKSDARILDATAGNRMIWKDKESPFILYIDIEPELEFPPDRVIDCSDTDFSDGRFTVIFFDPPHTYSNRKPLQRWHSCRNKKELAQFNEKYNQKRAGLSYYGEDKYKTKIAWLAFLNKAQREFQRILSEDGMLWMKWSEMRLPLDKVLPLFKNWTLKLKFYIGSPHQKKGGAQTYWLMFMKTRGLATTARLEE